MFDPRNNLANEVSAQLITHFGDKVFRTIIPRNIRLAEAPSFGKPVLFHDKESRGALSYLALAGEMIRREKRRRAQRASGSLTPPADRGGRAGRPIAGRRAIERRRSPASRRHRMPTAVSAGKHHVHSASDPAIRYDPRP